MAWLEWLKDQLIRESSFRKPPPDGPIDRDALAKARCIMFAFYLSFAATLVYMIYYIFFAGRIEVYVTSYKQDVIEAPSVAICPFNSDTHVNIPRGTPVEDSIDVFKFGVDGMKKLNTTTRLCEYDRGCACVELWRVPSDEPLGHGIVFRDHLQQDTQKIGATGQKSKRAMAFRERIEIRTNITEPSPDRTLKVGFYDSIDTVPQWFYMAQESFSLGALELQTWTVSDLTFGAMWKTLKGMLGMKGGDLKATFSQRHIFRYTSQEVPGSVQTGIATYISYEMRHFFVDDTVSSETAFSPYSLLFLCFLIAVRSAIREVFINVMFPVYDPHKNKEIVREMSWYADTTVDYCGCCSCSCFGRRSDEQQPLLDDARP